MATSPPKHVVVIGGGLVGVATANSLAREGADVTVIERGPSVALGTSFGNAGRFAVTALLDGPISSPSAAYRTLWSFISRPFTSTELPLTKRSSSGASSVRMYPDLLSWGAYFLLASWSPGRIREGNAVCLELAKLCPAATQTALGDMQSSIVGAKRVDDIISRRDGTLFLFRSKEFATASKAMVDASKGTGVVATMLHKAECEQRFPWLARWKGRGVVGAVLAPTDWSADAKVFTEVLANSCSVLSGSEGRGRVSFLFNTQVTAVDVKPARYEPKDVFRWVATKVIGPPQQVTSVMLSSGRRLACDAVVVCAGMHSKPIVKNLFHKVLPLASMRGYSLELRGCEGTVPNVAVADDSSGAMRFQILPLNNGNLRLIGFAEFVPSLDPEATPADLQRAGTLLVSRAKQVLPQLTWASQTPVWSGCRPMAPDGLPMTGHLPGYANVYVNCGHGTLGWTECCATGDMIASMAQGKPVHPALTVGLAPSRFMMTSQYYAFAHGTQ